MTEEQANKVIEASPIVVTNLMRTKANIVLDASKIDLFETCPARYNFRHNLNKDVAPHQKAEALDKGSLAHEGLEVYYKALAEGINYAERVERAKMKIRERSSDPDNSNLEAEDINLLLNAIEQSCDYWRAEDENCLNILAVEQPFAYLLHEDEFVRIIITGKIDILCDFNGIGRNASYKNLVIDHKTFSRDGKVLRKSNQFINYCAAAETNYLVVNRIGLYEEKSKKSASEKFQRVPLSYDPVYIADWKSNLTKMLLNEYLGCVAENYWPEKPTSCDKFNRICEYYDICDSSGQAAKDFKLQSNYFDAEVWDVSKKLESEIK